MNKYIILLSIFCFTFLVCCKGTDDNKEITKVQTNQAWLDYEGFLGKEASCLSTLKVSSIEEDTFYYSNNFDHNILAPHKIIALDGIDFSINKDNYIISVVPSNMNPFRNKEFQNYLINKIEGYSN